MLNLTPERSTNVEVTGAARLYRASSVLTAGLVNYFARR